MPDTWSSPGDGQRDDDDVDTATAQIEAFYTDLSWDFSDIWTIDEDVSYPALQ